MKILYDALDKIKSKNNEDPIKIFNSAISNVKSNIECRSRRVGGAISSARRSKTRLSTCTDGSWKQQEKEKIKLWLKNFTQKY